MPPTETPTETPTGSPPGSVTRTQPSSSSEEGVKPTTTVPTVPPTETPEDDPPGDGPPLKTTLVKRAYPRWHVKGGKHWNFTKPKTGKKPKTTGRPFEPHYDEDEDEE
ncbi:hypothetical protein BDV34DRAFT_200306 [Aspergillus parasiticus]|nr:hypothetical protein BDV34DRAFT_200306 [Aspergillus parasiticus]